ncbi:MAG: hypothetical protein H8E62_03230 [Planctomycetes bacterium]|nr:hypothetical protein [Planctomycetota bacterium]
MGWQWSGKQDVIVVFILLLAVPTIGAIIASLFSTIALFTHSHPILFWLFYIVLVILGFIVVCKRAGKKDKKE